MLQPPVTTMPAQAGGLIPVPPASGVSADAAGAGGSLIERLLVHAQDAQDNATQQLSRHFDQLNAGRLSTSDLLRMQGDMGAFAVQVQITVRVADEIGRAIQTLSQRS